MPQGSAEGRDGSLLSNSLRGVASISAKWPRVMLVLVALVTVASIFWTVRELQFKTDRADLINPDADYHRRWINYTRSFGDALDAVVVVEADNAETISRVLDELGTRLLREPESFSNVLYKIEPGPLRSKGLQSLPPNELQAGLNRLTAYLPVIQGRWDLLRLDSLFSRFQYQFESRTAAIDPADPLIKHAEMLTDSLSSNLANPHAFSPPWPPILSDPWLRCPPNRDIFFLNEKGTLGFLKTALTNDTKDFSGRSRALSRLRELATEIESSHPFTKIALTGIPVLESDEMSRSQSDMSLATVISTVGVGVLLFWGFRGFRHPLLAMLVLLIGMAWTFGYTTLAVGHLNILSVSFAVILIGLGIDYSIYFMARYLELRQQGQSPEAAVSGSAMKVGTGILTSAVTMALAFFCAALTDFRGVAELGVIAGGGILLCAGAMFLTMPALLAASDGKSQQRKLPVALEYNWLRTPLAKFPVLTLIVAVVAVIGVGSQIFAIRGRHLESRIRYDSNLLNLQAVGMESVEVQQRVFQESRDSLLYAVSVANSPQEAVMRRKQFESLPTVDHVVELASRISSYPGQNPYLLQSYQMQLASLPQEMPMMPPPDPAAVGKAMERFYVRVRANTDAASQQIARRVDSFLNRFEQLTLKQQTSFLAEYQARMVGALLMQFQSIRAASSPAAPQFADLPPELASRFVSRDGKWLLQVYPKQEIWDGEPLQKFVSDIRSVDPEVTGTPLQNLEASRQIRESFQTAALYAFSVICLALFIDLLDGKYKALVLVPPLIIVVLIGLLLHARRTQFNPVMLALTYVALATVIAGTFDRRNLRDAILALLPPLAGSVLMFGLMAICHIDLNPANLIVLPLMIGTGVESGVHLVHDFRLQQRSPQYKTSASIVNSVVMSSLSTMIGFASLMLAAHRGLRSLGLVLTLGMASCLLVSLILLPAILTIMARRQAPKTRTVSMDDARNRPQPRERAA